VLCERGIDFADIADPTSSGVMKKIKARAVLIDGKAYQKKPDGSLVPLSGRTDWKRLDRQTSARIEAIAAADRMATPMSDAEWAKAEIVSGGALRRSLPKPEL